MWYSATSASAIGRVLPGREVGWPVPIQVDVLQPGPDSAQVPDPQHPLIQAEAHDGHQLAAVRVEAERLEPVRLRRLQLGEQPARRRTPTSARGAETESKNPFDLDRRYEKRVGCAADYSKVVGQLYYVHIDGGVWILRYAPLSQEDGNGGSVVLAHDRWHRQEWLEALADRDRHASGNASAGTVSSAPSDSPPSCRVAIPLSCRRAISFSAACIAASRPKCTTNPARVIRPLPPRRRGRPAPGGRRHGRRRRGDGRGSGTPRSRRGRAMETPSRLR